MGSIRKLGYKIKLLQLYLFTGLIATVFVAVISIALWCSFCAV